jgi:hypothetical protein
LIVDLGHQMSWNTRWNYYQYARVPSSGLPHRACPRELVDGILAVRILTRLSCPRLPYDAAGRLVLVALNPLTLKAQ